MVQDKDKFSMCLMYLDEEGQAVQQWEWEGQWGEERKIQLP